jgi:hypothetical protein
MEPLFIIREIESGVEYNFQTSKGKELFQWMKAPDDDTAEVYIRKIQRRCNPDSFNISIITAREKDRFYFKAFDSEGRELLRSIAYTSLHRVKGGRELLVREMHGAKIYTSMLKG